MERIRESLETVVQKSLESMNSRKTFITAVKLLDRASIKDKECVKMVTENIERVNKVSEPFSVGDLRFLMNFLRKRDHLMPVRTYGIKTVSGLANDLMRYLLLESQETDEKRIAIANQSLVLAKSIRGYDYETLNPAIAKESLKKSYLDSISID